MNSVYNMILIVKKKKKDTYVERLYMHLKSKEYKPKSGRQAETATTFCHTQFHVI